MFAHCFSGHEFVATLSGDITTPVLELVFHDDMGDVEYVEAYLFEFWVGPHACFQRINDEAFSPE